MTRSAPRWDGHRLLFVLMDEDRTEVRCAISRVALLAISGGGPLRSTDLPALFAAARDRIEAAALAKLRARASPPLGVLHIWEDDMLEPEPSDMPADQQAGFHPKAPEKRGLAPNDAYRRGASPAGHEAP
jgi:hypothetical protein